LLGYTKEKSSIIVIGLNVHTAPVEMREKLAIPEAQWPQVIQELCALNHIEEAAVLSTCNRIEIYLVALSQHRAVREVTDWISKVLLIYLASSYFILFCIGLYCFLFVFTTSCIWSGQFWDQVVSTPSRSQLGGSNRYIVLIMYRMNEWIIFFIILFW
jgi:hypothetical protein